MGKHKGKRGRANTLLEVGTTGIGQVETAVSPETTDSWEAPKVLAEAVAETSLDQNYKDFVETLPTNQQPEEGSNLPDPQEAHTAETYCGAENSKEEGHVSEIYPDPGATMQVPLELVTNNPAIEAGEEIETSLGLEKPGHRRDATAEVLDFEGAKAAWKQEGHLGYSHLPRLTLRESRSKQLGRGLLGVGVAVLAGSAVFFVKLAFEDAEDFTPVAMVQQVSLNSTLPQLQAQPKLASADNSVAPVTMKGKEQKEDAESSVVKVAASKDLNTSGTDDFIIASATAEESVPSQTQTLASDTAGKAVVKNQPSPISSRKPLVKKFSGWFVQLAAFTEEAEAQGASQELLSGAWEPSIQKAEVNGQVYYRLLVGPQASRSESNKILRSLRDSGLAPRDAFPRQFP